MNPASSTMDQKPKIRPRGALLIVSALILAFPDLHVIDVLPDVFACILML